MWRIYGLVFFNDAGHFQVAGEKRFDAGKIRDFLMAHNIALCPTVRRAVRERGNASDKFLRIVELTFLSSESYVGQALREVYPHFTGRLETTLAAADPAAIAAAADVAGRDVDAAGEAGVDRVAKVRDGGADKLRGIFMAAQRGEGALEHEAGGERGIIEREALRNEAVR